jgi:hypothetical protein
MAWMPRKPCSVVTSIPGAGLPAGAAHLVERLDRSPWPGTSIQAPALPARRTLGAGNLRGFPGVQADGREQCRRAASGFAARRHWLQRNSAGVSRDHLYRMPSLWSLPSPKAQRRAPGHSQRRVDRFVPGSGTSRPRPG